MFSFHFTNANAEQQKTSILLFVIAEGVATLATTALKQFNAFGRSCYYIMDIFLYTFSLVVSHLPHSSPGHDNLAYIQFTQGQGSWSCTNCD